MSQTRWKLLACGLGISLVGVVAIANPQCNGVEPKQTQEVAPTARAVDTRPVAIPMSREKKAESVKSEAPRPVPIPGNITPPQIGAVAVPPSPAPTLELSLPSLPAPAPQPVTQPIPTANVALPQIAVPVSTPKEAAPVTLIPVTPGIPEIKFDTPPLPKPELKVDLPPAAKPVTVPPLPGDELELLPPMKSGPNAALPTMTPTPKDIVIDLPLPGAAPQPALPSPVKPMPSKVEARPPELPSARPALEPPQLTLPRAEPQGKPETKPAARPQPDLTDVKLEEYVTRGTEEVTPIRVIVQLGTGQAQFLMMRGQETLLKAVSDSIEVRSPSEKGNHMSPLKAGGKVKFTAPGCEGTCDSLTVQPVTGEIELTGNVSVLCRQGMGETQMNGSSMKFKFGTLPTMTPSRSSTIPPTSVPTTR